MEVVDGVESEGTVTMLQPPTMMMITDYDDDEDTNYDENYDQKAEMTRNPSHQAPRKPGSPSVRPSLVFAHNHHIGIESLSYLPSTKSSSSSSL